MLRWTALNPILMAALELSTLGLTAPTVVEPAFRTHLAPVAPVQ